MPRRLNSFFVILIVCAVFIAGILGYRSGHREAQVLPNDNFNQSTLEILNQAIKANDIAKLDYNVYVVTGGLGIANPRILSWDTTGDVTFGQPNGSLVFDIKQFGAGFPNVTLGGKPIPWMQRKIESGTTYYKYIPSNSVDLVLYYFQKGNTYIRLMISGADGIYPFPQDLPDHLKKVE